MAYPTENKVKSKRVNARIKYVLVNCTVATIATCREFFKPIDKVDIVTSIFCGVMWP